ncbi:MAG: helix-turn-helix transcriptional regulator [Oscillospiraceae bacterium]|nr:helix-turn-helix transcriptional regulator [Oscillospiraceae bacterium]
MSFFGANLKKARKQCGLTQRQLAGLVGAKHNSISNWETGQNEPDTQMIRKLCDTLSVSANDLFGSDATAASPPISRNELKFALFEGDGKVTEDMLQEVLDFAQFVKEKYRKKEKR